MSSQLKWLFCESLYPVHPVCFDSSFQGRGVNFCLKRRHLLTGWAPHLPGNLPIIMVRSTNIVWDFAIICRSGRSNHLIRSVLGRYIEPPQSTKWDRKARLLPWCRSEPVWHCCPLLRRLCWQRVTPRPQRCHTLFVFIVWSLFAPCPRWKLGTAVRLYMAVLGESILPENITITIVLYLDNNACVCLFFTPYIPFFLHVDIEHDRARLARFCFWNLSLLSCDTFFLVRLQ